MPALDQSVPNNNPGSGSTRHSPISELTPEQRSERAGFGKSSEADVAVWAGRLGAGWYLDWGVMEKEQGQEPEHWQMVRLGPGCTHPDLAEIYSTALHSPGQVWILGNEPDVIWQDNLSPEDYAIKYHALYGLIKSADPSARIATAGISQATPLRLEYLDRVLETYKVLYHTAMPVDIWTVHGFVLREERGSWGVSIPPGMDMNQGKLYEIRDHDRLDLFKDQIRAFRTWMADRGYRGQPLALTEFGILMPGDYGFPSEKVGRYLTDTFGWLQEASDSQTGYPPDGYRLVQRWAWFSLADPYYPNSNLLDFADGDLTTAGAAFREYAINNPRTLP